MQPRAGESSKIKVSGVRKSFENRSKNIHEKQMILGMHFSRKNSAQIDQTLTLNANQSRLKKSMKKINEK